MTVKKILFSSVCALALCGTSVFAEGVQDSSSSAPTQTQAKSFEFPWATLSSELDTAKTKAEEDYKKALGSNANTLMQAVTDAKGALGVEAKGEESATLLYKTRDEAQKKLDDKIATIGTVGDKSDTKVGDTQTLTLYAELKKAADAYIGTEPAATPDAASSIKTISDALKWYSDESKVTDKAEREAATTALNNIKSKLEKNEFLTAEDYKFTYNKTEGGSKTDVDLTTVASALDKTAYEAALQTVTDAIAQTEESDKGASNTLADKLAAAQKAITDQLDKIEKAEKELTVAENKTAESKKATAEYKALLEKQALFDEAAKAQQTINNGTTAAVEALAKAKAGLGEKDAKADNGADASAYAKYNYAKEEISKAQKALGNADDKASDAEGATLYAKLNKAGADLVGTASEKAPSAVADAKNLADLLAVYEADNADDKNKTNIEAVKKAIEDIQAGKIVDLAAGDIATALSGANGIVKDAYNTAKGEIETAESNLGTDRADGSGVTLFDKLAQADEALQQAIKDVNTKTEDLAKAKQAVVDAKATLEKAVLYTDDGIKAVASVKASLGEYASIAGGKANVLAAKFALVGSDISKADKEQQKEIQTVANEIAKTIVDNKKEEISSNALTSLAIQLNNMNKRLGEVRGMGGDTGVWTRVYGGKYSTDYDKFNYYSAQIGADKKSALKDGDLILGILAGYDKVNADIKTDAYSFGIYGSYIHNSGFFADSVMKFVSTSHDKSGWDIANQKSFLASLEGGYRFDASESFYVEPSLEFITGHVSEYSAKQAKTTTTVESFSPVIFKPQTFIGVNLDDLAFRFGGGYVLNAKKQEANIMIEDIVAGVNASASTKLEKNNHGFVSLGTSYKIGDNLRLNLSAERTFGSELQKDYEINTTVRYSF